jgi:hypothetical protein
MIFYIYFSYKLEFQSNIDYSGDIITHLNSDLIENHKKIIFKI